MYTFHSVNYNLLRGGFIKYKGGGGIILSEWEGGGGLKSITPKLIF